MSQPHNWSTLPKTKTDMRYYDVVTILHFNGSAAWLGQNTLERMWTNKAESTVLCPVTWRKVLSSMPIFRVGNLALKPLGSRAGTVSLSEGYRGDFWPLQMSVHNKKWMHGCPPKAWYYTCATPPLPPEFLGVVKVTHSFMERIGNFTTGWAISSARMV